MRILLVACVVGMLAVGAGATETGGGAYPNGAEGFMSGAVPPPGQYLVNYLMAYRATDLMDNNGDEIPVDFEVTAYAEVLRFINVTPTKILGGYWAQHIFVPVTYLDVTTPGGSDDAVGLGDIIVDPCILSWHSPTFHAAVGVDVYVPVGTYDEDDIANIGRNYWTIEPVVAMSYLCPGGFEASAKFMYDFNTENTDTDYESGDEFHFDWTLAQHFGKKWTLGVGGYIYKQTSDDDGMVMTPAGPADAGPNRGQVYAIGPQLHYQCGPLGLILKYQHELEAENKPEGGRAWFKCVLPF